MAAIKPLPDLVDRKQYLGAKAPIRFIFIDADLFYIDERGEHSGLLSDSADVEEERSRLRTASNNLTWLTAAVTLGNQLIDLARRAGEEDAWGCTSGYFNGANPGPNRVAKAIKNLTGIQPPPPGFGPLTRPDRGRWSVRRVFGYDPGPDAPAVAVWHLGFSENPQFWPRFCEAVANRGTAPTIILPDSPISREMAKAWQGGQLYAGRQAWQSDGIESSLGEAAYLRASVSGVLETDGSTIDGPQFSGSVAFLESRHQLRVSPFDLLRDPVLASQIKRVEAEPSEWSSKEKTSLVRLRRQFDRPQRIYDWLEDARQHPPTNVFSDGESYPSSVRAIVHTARRAIRTGQLAPVLISSWTGFAPSALDRGEKPNVPATGGTYGLLVNWYRTIFQEAALRGIIEEDWFAKRERWHAHAFETYPAEVQSYYERIYEAERVLRSPQQRQSLLATNHGTLHERWYIEIFELAEQLGLCQPVPRGEVGE